VPTSDKLSPNDTTCKFTPPAGVLLLELLLLLLLLPPPQAASSANAALAMAICVTRTTLRFFDVM
jgi:hypothetical protein